MDIKFGGRTTLGDTGGRSHYILIGRVSVVVHTWFYWGKTCQLRKGFCFIELWFTINVIQYITVLLIYDNSAMEPRRNENMNAPRPFEHPPVRGENVKTFTSDHCLLQRQNLFIAFKRLPPW